MPRHTLLGDPAPGADASVKNPTVEPRQVGDRMLPQARRAGERMHWSKLRRTSQLLILPLWLPLAILVVSAIRFATLSPGEDAGGIPVAVAMIALMVLFAWIAAFPLTLAVTFLHRRVRALAYV